MRKLTFLALQLSLQASLHAQDRCATTIIDQANGTAATTAAQGVYAKSAGITAGTASEQLSNGGMIPDKIIIPVVVHLLYRTDNENISDDQILSQIESLNADFNRENEDFSFVPAIFANRAARTNIRFTLATVDPAGRATNGILRKKTSAQIWINDDRIKSEATGGSSPWDSRQYLNIWVGNTSSSLLGFSSFPGAPAGKDGIVIRYDVFGTRGRVSSPWNKGRTLTHEVGHWLGLRHLWGDTPCGDDGVDDTPRQRSGNRGLPVFPRVNTGCENGPAGDMFMNFMDFSDDAALLMFTAGQASVMRAQFAPGGSRHSILQSKGVGTPWNGTVSGEAVASSQTDKGGLSVYPNPVSSAFRVRMGPEAMDRPAGYTIRDAAGRPVLAGQLTGGSAQLDVSRLPAGIYYLSVDGKVTRFIKS